MMTLQKTYQEWENLRISNYILVTLISRGLYKIISVESICITCLQRVKKTQKRIPSQSGLMAAPDVPLCQAFSKNTAHMLWKMKIPNSKGINLHGTKRRTCFTQKAQRMSGIHTVTTRKIAELAMGVRHLIIWMHYLHFL